MNRSGLYIIFLVVWSLLCFSGCANIPKDDFSYMKNALVIDIKAQNNLNTYNNQPHTILLGLFELSDPNLFNQMLEQQDSVSKIFGDNVLDGNVLSRRKLVIQPGEHKQLTMDRIEGARYLGVVAGYYKLQQDKSTSRLYSVELDYTKKTIWSRAVEPKILVELMLGSDGLKK